MDLLHVLRQEHRRLAGGISTADDDHLVAAAQLCLDRRRGVVDTAAFEFRQSIERRFPVFGAGGDDDGSRAHARPAIESDSVRLITALQLRRCPRHRHLRAKLLRLRVGAGRQLLS